MDRREFLKLSGFSVAAAGTLAFNVGTAIAVTSDLRINKATEVRSICPHCAVGCGLIAHVENGNLIHLEGDVDHPISEGSLCPKGSSVYQFTHNDRRLLEAKYRKQPYSITWEEVEVG